MKKKPTNYKQLQQVSTAALLEESNHLRLILKGVILIAVLVVLFLIWASFTTIKETAVTYGELVPEGQVQLVQHLEGGIVTKVLVNNGERVRKGQLLMTFDPTATRAELAQLRSRDISLTLNAERLRAYLDSQNPNLAEWSAKVVGSEYNNVKGRAEIEKLLGDEIRHLQQQVKSRNDQQSILKDSIAQRQEKLKQIVHQQAVWDEHIKLLSEEFGMYRKLKKGKLISHKDYLIILREMNKAKGERVRLVSEIQQTKQSISEARNKLNGLTSELQEKALKELGSINDNLLEVRHQIEKLQDKLKRMNIKAPVPGIVKGVRAFASNVVKPGGLLLEIVPFGQQLVVETRITPRDIGHIKVGDQVNVKVLTYDFARYGSIEGTLIKISASTFTDDKGNPYYKATTSLNHQFVGADVNPHKLRPGMTVEANIVTGEKTLLQYLLKPIHVSAKSAFSER